MHHFLILSHPQLVLGGKLERRPSHSPYGMDRKAAYYFGAFWVW